ncbi:hypothetical protein SBADM41S_01204 [Streptomyces badius]
MIFRRPDQPIRHSEHELTERLAGTSALETALHELLQAGAALVGARRGLLVLEPANGEGPSATRGLGLTHAELGHIETVPRAATALGRVLDGLPETAEGIASPICSVNKASTPGTARSRPGSATPRATPSPSPPSRPAASARRSGSTTNRPSPHRSSATSPAVYARYATEHLARLIELERARADVAAVAEELLHRLPGPPASSSPPGTAPAPAAAATGTTRCLCRTARSASPSVPWAGPGRARWPRWAGSAPACGRTR